MGHVAFFQAYVNPGSGDGKLWVVDASGTGSSPEVGRRTIQGQDRVNSGKFAFVLRPTPFGSSGSAARSIS